MPNVLGHSLSSFGSSPATGIAVFQQAKLGGGGYAYQLHMAPDGSRMLVSGNCPNLYRWIRSTNKWDNVSTTPHMTAANGINLTAWSFGTVLASGWGPDSLRAYSVFSAPNQPQGVSVGAFHSRQSHCYIYRTDDGGDTWLLPSNQAVAGFCPSYPGACGPMVSVDPNNKDVCYVMAANGVVIVTRNAGASWAVVQTLLQQLPNCLSTQDINAGGNSLTVNSNPVFGAASNTYALYDADNPLALGTDSICGYNSIGATSTKIITTGAFQTKDGSGGNGLSVRNGDHIYFGIAGGVVIDGSGGTSVVGGVTCSNIIYFGWGNGVNSLWWTQNGDPESAVAMVGGPVAPISNMKISNDSTGAGDNNVLYVTAGPSPRYWRWVRNHPIPNTCPTVLTDSTWTNFPLTPVDGPCCMVPDPDVQGKMVYYSARGHTYYSTDYGNNNGGAYGSTPTWAGDTPWLQEGNDSQNVSDAVFQPGGSNKLWMADGNGTWWNNPATGGTKPTWNAQMQELQSLIITSVTKAPSPNGRIYLTAEDHPIVVCPSITSDPSSPTTFFNVTNGYSTCYAPDDPTKIFASILNSSQFWYSADKGDTWSVIGGSTLIAAPMTVTLNRGGITALSATRGIITTLNTLVGGTLYTPGIGSGSHTYTNVPLVYVTSGTGSGATASVIVTNGSVATVTITSGGSSYVNGDILTAAAANIGGTGSGFSITVAQTNNGSGYGPGSYTNVPLTGGNGSSATADITVDGTGIVTVVTLNVAGDLYAAANSLSASNANLGGSGSGFAVAVSTIGVFNTTNTSPTVTITEVAHGYATGRWIRLLGTSTFNNININDQALQITVTDANHYQVTATTNANASGFAVTAANRYMNAWYPGALGRIVSRSQTEVMIANTNALYGTTSDAGLTWKWDYVKVSGSPFSMDSGDPYNPYRPLAITDTGVIYYLKKSTNAIYTSNDGGATFSLISTGKVASQNWPAIATSPGNPTHLFFVPGLQNDSTYDHSNYYLTFSSDGGANFTSITNTAYLLGVALGPPKPGASYPSIYVWGVLQAGIANNYHASLYRCDDFNPASPNTCTWNDIGPQLGRVNCDGFLWGGVTPDPEVYGTIYIGTNDTGYIEAHLT